MIALCETSNLKRAETSIDDISRLIVTEISELETVGIRVDEHVLKGSIVDVRGDNLGANSFLGYVESFMSRFCRACETTKEESERATKEDVAKMRTKDSYEKCVEAAEKFVKAGKKIDFQVTKGVKRKCPFNDLINFPAIDNITFDVMHDVNEGAIPFLLSNFFNHMIENKIMSATEIQIRIRDFNYGELSKRNKPSMMNLDRKNLGQNASQSHCLFINVPFIFADVKQKLEDIWIGVESLLKCTEIIYSKEISEDDINQLTVLWFRGFFKTHLLPKHHFLTHYPEAIRRMSPLIYYWMMRVDSKHQVFTHLVKNTNNFVNIAKTLAKKHQAIMAYKMFKISDIEPSKKTIDFSKIETNHKDYVLNCLGENAKNNLLVHKFANFNSIQYREGLMFIFENEIYEIIHIFSLHDKITLFGRLYRVIKFESFLNSVEIICDDDKNQFKLVDPKKITGMKTYEKKFVDQKMYIVCDTLNVRKALLTSLK